MAHQLALYLNRPLRHPRSTLQPPGEELHDREHLLSATGHGILALRPLDVFHLGEACLQCVDGAPRDLGATTTSENEDGSFTL
jgi:hypothetical protein